MPDRACLNQLRFIALACCTLVTTACSGNSTDATGPQDSPRPPFPVPRAEAHLVGSYDLQSVAGHPVPYTSGVASNSSCSFTFISGNLTLALNARYATFTETRTVHSECPGPGPTYTVTTLETGAWESSSGTIGLFLTEPTTHKRYQSMTGSADGTHLLLTGFTATSSYYPYGYQRVAGQ